MKTNYLIDGLYICECGKTFEKSQSLNAHFSHCIIHRNGKPTNSYRGGGGWSKGLTKETHSGISKMAKTLSINLLGKKGTPHTADTKKHLSNKRIEFLEKNPGSNIKWYKVSNGIKEICVQGKWELDVANWLNDNSILWDRVRVKYDGHRTYTPDFWLPQYNFYIEVKGWLSDRDIVKMRKVINQTGIIIKLVYKKDYYNLSNISIKDLSTFN